MSSLTSKYDSNVSPVGWYIGTYQLRFVELDRTDIEDDEARFLIWENTVLVKASSLERAHDKVTEIGNEHTDPYKGGPEHVDVQWYFEGILELLPIYEEIEDGCEVMWAERHPRKLKNIRANTLTKHSARQ